MYISLEPPIKFNNNFAVPKSSYNQYLTNISFGLSETQDIFVCNNSEINEIKPQECKLATQEEIPDELIKFFFNPNKEISLNEEVLDQEKIGRFIEKLTEEKFEGILDSEKTIETLTRVIFNQEDIDRERKNISKKTIDEKVCLGFDFPTFRETAQEIALPIIKERINNISKTLDIVVEKYKNTRNNLEFLDIKFLSQQETKRKPSGLKKDFQDYLEQKKIKGDSIKTLEKKLKKLKAKLELYQNLKFPSKKEEEEIALIIGNAFENIAAKEVDRIVIPNIADKLAKKEGADPEDIKTQLRQVRNFKFDTKHTEIDHLIVRIKPDFRENINTQNYISNFKKVGEEIIPEPIEVVGIVETKYNPKNLKYGFDNRIFNIKWLKGQTSINGKLFAQNYYCDQNTGLNYYFGPDSFKNFSTNATARETYENIHFITSNSAFKHFHQKILNNKELTNCVDYSVSSFLNNYKDPELYKNIVIINTDYCGLRFEDLLHTIKYRDLIKLLKKNFLVYHNYIKI